MIIAVRMLVATLALTGAAATHFTLPTTEAHIGGKLSAFPIPCCPPNDPNACHITDGN